MSAAAGEVRCDLKLNTAHINRGIRGGNMQLFLIKELERAAVNQSVSRRGGDENRREEKRNEKERERERNRRNRGSRG